MGFARSFHAMGRAVLESASAAFQAAATPSQLPTQQKKPDVVMTPGFRYSSGIGTAGVKRAMDRTGAYSPLGRRMYPSIFAVDDLAVSKSWLFLASWQPAEGHTIAIISYRRRRCYRSSRNFPEHGGLIYKTLERPKLFPPRGKFSTVRPRDPWGRSCLWPRRPAIALRLQAAAVTPAGWQTPSPRVKWRACCWFSASIANVHWDLNVTVASGGGRGEKRVE